MIDVSIDADSQVSNDRRKKERIVELFKPCNEQEQQHHADENNCLYFITRWTNRSTIHHRPNRIG